VTDDILMSAREHLAAEGPEGLSLRAIARDLDMGVSSLYRYFPSRDDLLTELLVEAFDDQADAVEAAAARFADPVEALRAGVHAYRDWSLRHPPEFALAYGTPVPGFQAPAERTVQAGVRVGGILIDLLYRAWAQDRIDALPASEREAALSVSEREGLDALLVRRGYSIPVGLMSLIVDLFVRIHGFVVMEAFGQLRPMAADPVATFERTFDDACAAVGLRR
jgi:AcrR family transcriptional regulator